MAKQAEVPIIFSPLLIHEEVAGKCNVKSAGYCECIDGKWIVSGGSVSLKLDARPQDADLLALHIPVHERVAITA